MPRFEPFSGLRYDPSRVRLDDVVAPPYDVISPDEHAALRARSPYNSVRIDLPDDDSGHDPYQAAARRITEWLSKGILRRDADPALYGYRMSYPGTTAQPAQTVGVIGALGLEPPGAQGIFPHEQTTPKATSDRLQLLGATKINTSPIWVLSLGKGLSDELARPQDQVGDTDAGSAGGVIDEDGVRHELWPITDPEAIARIAESVSVAPVVIADGHHRFETARIYRDERSGAAGAPGAHDLVMSLVVELAEDQLSVQGIHRLIRGLPHDFDLVGALSRSFDLLPTAAFDATIGDRMVGAAAMALVTPTETWLLRTTPETDGAAGQQLDSSRLEVALARFPEHHIAFQHGFDRAVQAVTHGEAQAAVLLRPVTVEQIARTGHGGTRMPPKTTFFWPKPRTGFVFREVAD